MCGFVGQAGLFFFNEISGLEKSLIFRILHYYYLFNGLFPHLPFFLSAT